MKFNKNFPTILITIPRLGISDRGAEVFIYELALKLARNFNITICVRKQKNFSKLISNLKINNINILYYDCIPAENILLNKIYSFKLFKKIQDKFYFNPDCIEMLTFSLSLFPLLLRSDFDLFFPTNGFWGSFVGYIIRIFRRIPFVYAANGGIEPMIARCKPDLYFIPNTNIYKYFRKHFPKLNSCYVPYGVDTDKFNPVGYKNKISLPKPVILTVAALVQSKKVEMTIKAVSKVKNCSFLIVGKGYAKDKLTKIAKKYLRQGSYCFTSSSYLDMPGIYRIADIFTLASPDEPFGIVYLESMASGLVSVVHNGEHQKKVFKSAGIYCNTNNLKEYSVALRKALKIANNPKTKKIIRNRSLEYSWDKLSGIYIEELNKIILK